LIDACFVVDDVGRLTEFIPSFRHPTAEDFRRIDSTQILIICVTFFCMGFCVAAAATNDTRQTNDDQPRTMHRGWSPAVSKFVDIHFAFEF
jgi:hypothetical protein